MRMPKICPALLVLCCGAVASAQPVIDGTRTGDDALYGPPKWVQTNPTNRTDNHPSGLPGCTVGQGVTIAINNANIVGVAGGCAAPAGGELPGDVTTGIEIRIPLSQLGNPTGDIRIVGFVNGSNADYMSNQVFGGFTAPQCNLGSNGTGSGFGNISGVNFQSFAGDQFITILTTAVAPATPPVMDGSSAGEGYPAPVFVQTVQTQFGNATQGNQGAPTNGSEIDSVSGFIGTYDLGNGPQAYLYLFVAGNLEANFNRLQVLFDSVPAAGQNPILANNTPVDGLGNAAGFTMDAGVEPDYYLSMRCGDQTNFAIYADYAQLPTAGGGEGHYIGSGGSGANPLNGSPVCPGLPDPVFSIGSELDAVYSYIDTVNQKLYVLVTGNLQSQSEDKLNLFFDVNGNPTGDEGQNNIRTDNVLISIADGGAGSINRMGNNGVDPGLTFDTGFAPDYYINAHFEPGNNNRRAVDAAVLRTAGKLVCAPGINSSSLDYGSYNGFDGDSTILFDGMNFGCCTGAGGLQFQDCFSPNVYSGFAPRDSTRALQAAIDAGVLDLAEFLDYLTNNPDQAPRPGLIQARLSNRNIGGVTASDVSGAASATDGFEFCLDLNELGWNPASRVRMAGFITSGNYATVFNQVLGSLPDGAGDQGDVRQINFGNSAGNQWVRVAGCKADFNQDGNVSSQDIFDFLAAFFSNNPRANYNKDQGISSQDIFDFLAGFFSGCR